MPYIGTTAVLGNAGVYDSGAQRTLLYDNITGTVFANQAGTLNVEQSFDGTNWDTNSSTAVSASTGTSFNVTVVAPWYRLRYVNGATPQTTFRLSARLAAAGKN